MSNSWSIVFEVFSQEINMNRWVFVRILFVVLFAVLGVFGAITPSSPVLAAVDHHAELVQEAVCQEDGTYLITGTFSAWAGNGDPDSRTNFDIRGNWHLDDGPRTEFVQGEFTPENGFDFDTSFVLDGDVVGTLRVQVVVVGDWENGVDGGQKTEIEVPLDPRPCEPKSSVTPGKEVVNDDEGTLTEDDFTPQVNGVNVEWDEEVLVDPGEVFLSEISNDEYQASVWRCVEKDSKRPKQNVATTLDVKPGEHWTCVITNNDKPKKRDVLVIKTNKHVDGSQGPGVGTVFSVYTGGTVVDGTMTVTGTLVVTGTTNGKGEVVFRLLPGTYQICETVPVGYEPEDGPCKEVVVGFKEPAPVQFFNKEIPTGAKAIKCIEPHINKDDKCQAGESRFSGLVFRLTLAVDGTFVMSATTDAQGVANFPNLEPGVEYKLCEILPEGEGYSPSSGDTCKTFTLAAGQTLVLHFGNYKEPTALPEEPQPPVDPDTLDQDLFLPFTERASTRIFIFPSQYMVKRAA